MGLIRKIFFNLWYFQKPPWDTGISPPELLAFIESHPAGRALDLGCGTGTNVITLARHGWRATGIDFAWLAIWLARRKIRRAGVSANLKVGDVTRSNIVDGPFDLILDIGCFHGLSAQNKIVYAHNLEHWLAPGGTVLLYGFFKTAGESGSGLVDSDVELITSSLRLLHRQDGADRRQRPSAWFKFRRDD